MPILYYANSPIKRYPHVMEKLQRENRTFEATGSQDITSTPLSQIVWNPAPQWQINEISLVFSSSSNKNYSAALLQGRGILKGLNDSIWFKVNGAVAQKMVLTPGFYDGNTLSTELQTQLNANAAFTALSLTFSVSYTASTGLFSITPSSGNIQYVQENTGQLVYRDSTAGIVFGFTVNSAASSPLTNDTPAFGLGNTVAIGLTATASANTSVFSNTVYPMDVDTALQLTTNTAAMNAQYHVVYQTKF